MDQTCAAILSAYREFVSAATVVEDEGDHCRLLTPLYLPDNTQLSVCLEHSKDGEIVITDYGDTEAFLFLSGLSLESNDPRRIRVSRRFGVSNEDGAIEKRLSLGSSTTSLSEVANAINDVIHAMLDTAYLTVGQRPRRLRAFAAEVEQFLDSHGSTFVRGPRVLGKSGNQPFEFSIHQRTGVYLADAISANRRDIAKRDAQVLVFKAEDVAAVAGQTYRFVCLLDDRTDETRSAIDPSVLAPLDAWNIDYVRWSERESSDALAA